MRWWVSAVVLLLIILMVVPSGTEAHAPKFPAGNDSVDNAYSVDEVSKSLVIYNHLESGGVQYYTLEVDNERLLIQILVPVGEVDKGFRPQIALMVPGWNVTTTPYNVTVPDGYGLEVLPSSVPEEAEYEGITATAFYVLMEFDEPSDGLHDGEATLIVAVFDENNVSGDYALVVGYEERFTLMEMLLIPFDLISIYQWQGSEILLVVTPISLLLLMGGVLMYRMRSNGRLDITTTMGIVGGTLMMGTAATVIVQMLVALGHSGLSAGALVTSILIMMGLVGGLISVLLSISDWEFKRRRMLMVVSSLLGLLSFNGLLIGPVMVFVAAVKKRP